MKPISWIHDDTPGKVKRLAGERDYLISEAGEEIPFRRIDFSCAPPNFGGRDYPSIYLPDVTGPFGENWIDENAPVTDFHPKLRRERAVGSDTQLTAAKKGVVTPEMSFVAGRENLGLEATKKRLDELHEKRSRKSSRLSSTSNPGRARPCAHSSPRAKP